MKFGGERGRGYLGEAERQENMIKIHCMIIFGNIKENRKRRYEFDRQQDKRGGGKGWREEWEKGNEVITISKPLFKSSFPLLAWLIWFIEDGRLYLAWGMYFEPQVQ